MGGHGYNVHVKETGREINVLDFNGNNNIQGSKARKPSATSNEMLMAKEKDKENIPVRAEKENIQTKSLINDDNTINDLV